MSIRDEEIKRLIKYAQGVDTKITFSSKDTNNSAEWILDEQSKTTELIIYTKPWHTKTHIIMCIVHELAHQMSYIYSGRKLSKKIHKVTSKEEHALTKKERKIIYEMEVNDFKYQYNIWQEVNIKIPLWKLTLEQGIDEYVYKIFYKENRFPSRREKRIKRKELRETVKRNL